jgi:capsular exopolysaccharide synthesis family protein
MNSVITAGGHPVEDHGRSEQAGQPGGDKSAVRRPGPVKKPSPPHGVETHLVTLLTPASFEAEQYQALRFVIEELHKSAKLTLIAVTGATPGDGKTITAINLAGALAQSPDTKVLLVDADIRRPSVAAYLGLPNSTGPGLVGALQSGSLNLEQVVRQDPRFNFSVLPAGRPLVSSYDALKSLRLEKLLTEARQRYEFVVIDTPPLVPVPDCRIIEKLIDGFLLVVAAHKTPRKLTEESLNVLNPAKVIGLVFNNDDRPLGGYYEYYSAYDPAHNGDNTTGWWGGVAKKIRRSFQGRQVTLSNGKNTS